MMFTYEGWKNQETWAIAFYFDNNGEETQYIAILAAYSSSFKRNPSYSFQCGLTHYCERANLLIANIDWGELYNHFLRKFLESKYYKLLNWLSGYTPCGVCGKETMNHLLSWYQGKHWCDTCYAKLFKECPICHRRTMGVKSGRMAHPDNMPFWDGHRHTFSESSEFYSRYPKVPDPEEMCEACFDKKHGLVSVRIT
jgi:hypothetical protein